MERLNAFFKNYVAELDVARREGSYCGLLFGKLPNTTGLSFS